MSKSALAELDFELVTGDGVPMENPFHGLQMHLFLSVVDRRMEELGRTDFYSGGDMFVYYSVEQAQAVAEEERQMRLFEQGELAERPKKTAFRGPDAFLVQGVDPRFDRPAWVAWEEDGRLPDLILELLSPSTAAKDRGEKKRLYEQVFKTSEYFLYPPQSRSIEGWRLLDNSYQRIAPSSEGRLWSRELEAELGVWEGEYRGRTGPWLRLFRSNGELVPTDYELERQRVEEERQRADEAHQRADEAHQRADEAHQRAEAERQRADEERQRAEAAEAELERLRARLAELEG